MDVLQLDTFMSLYSHRHYQYCLTAGLFIHQHAPFSIRSRKKPLRAAVHLCLMTCWELSQQAFLINKAIKQAVSPRSLPGGVEEVSESEFIIVIKTPWLIEAQVYAVEFCFSLIVSVQWRIHWAVTYAGKCFMISGSQGNVERQLDFRAVTVTVKHRNKLFS